jgi:hypothetical protein
MVHTLPCIKFARPRQLLALSFITPYTIGSQPPEFNHRHSPLPASSISCPSPAYSMSPKTAFQDDSLQSFGKSISYRDQEIIG